MKIRIISVFVIFALAVLLPLAARQTPAPEVPKADAKSVCPCCGPEKIAPAGHDHAAMAYCKEESSSEMSCCKSKLDNAKSDGGKRKMECDNHHDAKLCGGKECKSGSASQRTKSCCGKDTKACDSKDSDRCCGGMPCSKHAA